MPLQIVGEPTPKQDDRVVIAHISDLHFDASSKRDDAVRKALCEDLINAKADLIAITGDVIDSSVWDNLGKKGVRNSLRTVKNYLVDDICGAAKVDAKTAMLVIPGNHDFRITGLFWKQAQFDYFHEEFDSYFGNRLFQKLGLCLFTFDSNSPDRPLNFASGLVKEQDLIEHRSQVRQIAKESAEWNAITRVALVHHHPMPIAPTQHRDKITAGEEYMLLKNAGMFMEVMVGTKMDLVLHGHRHYPAYSRVSFPTSEGRDHSIAIVAAGSVGKLGDANPYSYNLITVWRSGVLFLERRVRAAAVYEEDRKFFISNYEEAREKRCQRKKEGEKQIRADKYIRVDTIRAGSGDAVIDETFYGAQSLDEKPIDTMKRTLISHSGVFGDWRYDAPEGQEIDWAWDGPPHDGERDGTTTLKPPLGRKPLTFSRHGTTFNAIYFNQRDRLDATDKRDNAEWTTMSTRHIYDSVIQVVSFPPESFPLKFRLEVTGPDEKTRDYQEEEFLQQRLTRFPSTSSVILALSKPLPDYSYRIVWDLPADDIEEHKLNLIDRGFAEDIVKRLGSLHGLATGSSQAAGGASKNAVRQAMSKLRDEILSVPAFQSPIHDDQLEIELFAYKASVGGLVCVSTLSDLRPEATAAWVIKPGRFVVGQAFRRREEVVLVNLGGIQTEAGIYEPVPGFEDLPKHTVIFSLPLFYPVRNGSKVGALALGSRSNTSGLLRLHEDRAALLALKEQLAVWYAKELAPALGLPALPL